MNIDISLDELNSLVNKLFEKYGSRVLRDSYDIFIECNRDSITGLLVLHSDIIPRDIVSEAILNTYEIPNDIAVVDYKRDINIITVKYDLLKDYLDRLDKMVYNASKKYRMLLNFFKNNSVK